MFSAAKTSGPSGYNLQRSVRLRSSASAYFNRTFGTPTDNKKWTMSMWLKRGSLGGSINIFGSVITGGYFEFRFNTSDQIYIQNRVSSTNLLVANTTAVYRDPSAWYHIMFVFDSANATASLRNILYVNGVSQTLSANSGSGDACAFNSSGNTQYIGNSDAYTTFDGYLTEVNFIDGQALTPSSFGSTNVTTGVWQPLKYNGTYGTNGFYLNFQDNSAATAAAIGKDSSGNGNNWTPNNISVTAGVTYDSMTDVPTLTSATQSNFSVLNAVSAYSGLPISAANLQTTAVASGANWFSRSTTMGFSSGKIYAEFSMPSITSGAQGNPVGFGIMPSTVDFSAAGQQIGNSGYGYGFYCPDTAGTSPKKIVAGTTTAVGTGSATATTDIFMVAFDLTNGNAWFGKNGTWYAGDPSAGTGASITGITAGEYIFGLSVYRDGTYTNNTAAINFGQRPFTYTPPTGFVALNTYNLPTPTIANGAKYMAATLYSGNSSTQVITNSGGFQPDLVWIKSRSAATDNKLTDSVRGTTKALISNSTAAETTDATGLTSFNSNGFTLGASATYNNGTGPATYVGWQWQAGQGSSSSNTSGSITSTVSVSTTAGISIVSFTASGSAATVGHGLGVAPKMIIQKYRTQVAGWYVYNANIGAGNILKLETTGAASADTTIWNNTAPTSSVYSIGSGWSLASSVIAYCFSEVAGFSKFGSYTGNGSTDGPFVYCGFRPRFIMVKRTDTSAYNWWIEDSTRNTYNPTGLDLAANVSDAEINDSPVFDFLSNGFKQRNTFPGFNASGGTYIYAAFAENPLKNALAR